MATCKSITLWKQENKKKRQIKEKKEKEAAEQAQKIEASGKADKEEDVQVLPGVNAEEKKEANPEEGTPRDKNGVAEVVNSEAPLKDEEEGAPKKKKLTDEQAKLLAYYNSDENSHMMPYRIISVFLSLVFLVVVSLLRGSKGPSVIGLTACDGTYWIIYALFIVICLAALVVVIAWIRKRRKIKESVGFEFVSTDLNYTVCNSIALSLVAFIGEIFAALIGIGGGMFFNPLLLKLGQTPVTASGTGMFLVLYATIATVL